MTTEIITILAAFAPQFTRPTWKNIQILFLGAVLCRGARRVTSILRVMGLKNEKNFSKFHRILSHARWNGLALSKILLGLLIAIIPSFWPILIAVDETLCGALQSIDCGHFIWFKMGMYDAYCSTSLV